MIRGSDYRRILDDKYRVLLGVSLAQGTPRILGVAQAASRAPLTRPRGPQGLQNGAESWGHIGPGALPATPDPERPKTASGALPQALGA
eukprot:2992340-Pyramimonas_sp.AAC.1